MLLLILITKLVIASLLLVPLFFEKGRHFLFAHRKRFLLASVLIIFVALIYISYLQYQFWNSNEVTKILNSNQSFAAELDNLGIKFAVNYLDPLFRATNSFIKLLFPDYAGGTYLLFFLLTRAWGEYIISLGFALFFLWAMLYLNHKYDNRFFYDEEPYFGAVAIFITGWPGWLYYLIVLLSLFLIFNALSTGMARSKAKLIKSDVPETENARFPLYYFWLPVATLIILLMFYLQENLPYYYLLKI